MLTGCHACCSSHARRPQGGPGMAASIQGKLEECCIGWCSETCRIELTCGCGTTCPRNRAKLLSFLSLRLAFPICAPGVFHALERIAWILKESAKFDMAQQGKMSGKRCQPLQNQNKGRRGRELPHSSCASLGRGRHAQSCAKSP